MQGRYIDMKTLIYYTFLFFLTNQFILGQSTIDSSKIRFHPSPVIGWDSLKLLIQKPDLYPETLRRAGVTETIQLVINVDSTGNLLSITPYKVQGYDTLFITPIEKKIREIECKPGIKYGKYINDSAKLFFTFYLYYNDNPQYFLIGAPASLIEKVH